MWSAIIAAVGAVAVALVGVLVTRMEAFDSRTRLKRDIELLKSLEGSDRFSVTLITRHVQSELAEFARAEWSRREARAFNKGYRRLLGLCLVGLALTMILKHGAGAYTSLVLALLVALLSLAVIVLATLLVEVARLERVRRKRSSDGWTLADELLGPSFGTPRDSDG
ncbi:MAG TPA: hypothetical protein DIW80_03880 [Gordonia polyisoprenivorans]|uniref:hypothetical protein n=1 Tax=Gordonia polyisoprenivorans TaxID=84595 RepID=UPI000EEE85B3|nr:hypothetical protein [Gordonia polyisoprenivorans]UZF54328.1 hypothetical protein LH935_16400 [Gordonia polyisoprenivorans]HCS56516.1 hypothetical protein [Gordonia polyisoprenivorans]